MRRQQNNQYNKETAHFVIKAPPAGAFFTPNQPGRRIFEGAEGLYKKDIQAPRIFKLLFLLIIPCFENNIAQKKYTSGLSKAQLKPPTLSYISVYPPDFIIYFFHKLLQVHSGT